MEDPERAVEASELEWSETLGDAERDDFDPLETIYWFVKMKDQNLEGQLKILCKKVFESVFLNSNTNPELPEDRLDDLDDFEDLDELEELLDDLVEDFCECSESNDLADSMGSVLSF